MKIGKTPSERPRLVCLREVVRRTAEEFDSLFARRASYGTILENFHAEKRIWFLNRDRGMKCQRCLRDEATYRVYTDAIDMKVCFGCAEEACRLGIAVEVLHSSER
jgi:hypothetical protein